MNKIYKISKLQYETKYHAQLSPERCDKAHAGQKGSLRYNILLDS